MNRITSVLLIFSIGGIAAAEPAALPDQPFFDLPVYLATAASSGVTGSVDQNASEGPAAGAPESPAPDPKPTTNQTASAEPASKQPAQDKRAFGVLPNYRTADGSVPYQPITAKQKFSIAVHDSFDYPVLFTTGFFAGLSQLQGSSNDVYGQGVKGFAHRYGISYADQVVGNFFPEAIVPTLFHMDPRYFRKGEGSVKSRFGYAVSRIFVSKNDKGQTTFNSPEIIGNALASMTGLAYHVHQRTAGDALYQWGVTYITTDMIGQILKEFWPDIKHKMFTKHAAAMP